MPLPLIPILLGGAAVAAAGYGVKKGIDAYNDNEKAQEYHKEAQERHGAARRNLESRKSRCDDALETLGKIKRDILQTSAKRHADIYNKLSIDMNCDMPQVRAEITRLQKIQTGLTELNAATSLLSGAASGALAGFGAYGAVGLLGSASTGTSLIALSGAAATKATLAWFGGGSLAAGGLGIAGRTAVLGGIIAAPVIAVSSMVWAESAARNKYSAQGYRDSVKNLATAMDSLALQYEYLQNRAKEKCTQLNSLDGEWNEKMDSISATIRQSGVQVSRWNERERAVLLAMAQVAESVKNIIEAPLLSNDDPLASKIRELCKKCKDLSDRIQSKWGD
ncbi:MAG: hypothetical protein HDT11_01495 [Helicobacter sp.]|nr:hypothetical protein [Helicobacter sp.]